MTLLMMANKLIAKNESVNSIITTALGERKTWPSLCFTICVMWKKFKTAGCLQTFVETVDDEFHYLNAIFPGDYL
jgi:hypothetical protein